MRRIIAMVSAVLAATFSPAARPMFGSAILNAFSEAKAEEEALHRAAAVGWPSSKMFAYAMKRLSDPAMEDVAPLRVSGGTELYALGTVKSEFWTERTVTAAAFPSYRPWLVQLAGRYSARALVGFVVRVDPKIAALTSGTTTVSVTDCVNRVGSSTWVGPRSDTSPTTVPFDFRQPKTLSDFVAQHVCALAMRAPRPSNGVAHDIYSCVDSHGRKFYANEISPGGDCKRIDISPVQPISSAPALENSWPVVSVGDYEGRQAVVRVRPDSWRAMSANGPTEFEATFGILHGGMTKPLFFVASIPSGQCVSKFGTMRLVSIPPGLDKRVPYEPSMRADGRKRVVNELAAYLCEPNRKR